MAKKIEKKIRLQFKGTDAFPVYHGHPDWKDGDIREVPEDLAEYLLDKFEKHFIDVDAVKLEPTKPLDQHEEGSSGAGSTVADGPTSDTAEPEPDLTK